MRKEAKLLLQRAINSLILSVENFNRPWDRGRVESVLILLDHAFELLLKSAILHKGGKIRNRRANQTIGFDQCVRTAITMKIVTEEQALVLQTINSLRDAAQHHFVEISEQQLYLQSQAGLTLFKDVLKDVFGKDLTHELPTRVLPISTTPPTDIQTLFENEVSEVKKILGPKSRRKIEATAKLRSLAIIDSALRGEKIQPSDLYLSRLVKDIKDGKKLDQLFPGVVAINFSSSGSGPSLSLRITKKEGIPVHLVPEGTEGASVVAIKRVNELDYYNLSLTTLAEKIKLTSNKTLAVVRCLKLQENEKYFKAIIIGSSRFNRYSQEALNKIVEELPKMNLGDVWQKYGPKRKAKTAQAG